ncbi:hypothetical protein K457DRAFT_335336 [Linnemannia elongata AG-77]|uniref:Uncharacterized protein n=1 Tax=Linnemannia elongata AG-77 TaxID=1314771 RepID=A0A197JB37_9FUNG|nr:hypothetical protein K457DRAFT_335336 [Linnemannia elongata AG-77]
MSTHLLNYLCLLFSVGWCSLLLQKHTASWIHAYSFLHTFCLLFFCSESQLCIFSRNEVWKREYHSSSTSLCLTTLTALFSFFLCSSSLL